MFKTSTETDKLLPALLKAQTVINTATKTQTGARNAKYADINDVLQAVKEPLNDNGLILFQNVEHQEIVQGQKSTYVKLHVATRIIHAESGQWITSSVELPVTSNDAQAIGSAITYGRRYSLVGAVGLQQEDDDGRLASVKKKSSYQKRKDGDWPKHEAAIRSLKTIDDVEAYKINNREWYAELPDNHKQIVDDELDRRLGELHIENA